MVTYGHVVMDSQEDYSMQRWTAHRDNKHKGKEISIRTSGKKNKAINLNTRNKKGYKNLNYSVTAVHKQLFMRGREQLASSSTSL